MKNKKYTLYTFVTDDEGGDGVCLSKDFDINLKGNKHFMRIGSFDNINQLATLLQIEEQKSNDVYIRMSKNNTNSNIIFIPEDDIIYNDINYHLSEAKKFMEDLEER